MQGPQNIRAVPDDDAVARETRTDESTRGEELAWHRAETDRLRVLVDFLSRPIHAPGGSDPDPDVLTAYNLAIEAALNGIRRAASGRSVPSPT